jgi:enoyl-CoA hydratase/carnithine racemase
VPRSLTVAFENYRLEPGHALEERWQPMGWVDLTTWPADVPIRPASFPIVGVGAATHPLAAGLDAVFEPPVTLESVVRQVERSPHAAAATVQLLRSLEGLSCEPALTLESMCYGMLQASAEHVAWLAARPITAALPAGRVSVTRHAAVLRIVIERAHARNAIDRVLRDALYEAFAIAVLDSEVQQVRLTSVGSAFSVGGDLAEFGTTRDPATAHLIRSRTLPALMMARRAPIFHVHVQGACVGSGLEIAAFAGRLSAARNAWFQLPELSMGLIAGAGGCVSVPRRIGRQRTALLMLSGKRIDASTALRWGLVDAIEDLPPVDEGGADVSRS